jgi:hypothetical protein
LRKENPKRENERCAQVWQSLRFAVLFGTSQIAANERMPFNRHHVDPAAKVGIDRMTSSRRGTNKREIRVTSDFRAEDLIPDICKPVLPELGQSSFKFESPRGRASRAVVVCSLGAVEQEALLCLSRECFVPQ